MITPKKTLAYAIILLIVGGVLGYVAYKITFCSSYACKEYLDYTGQFLILFGLVASVSSAVLIFLHHEVFISWWKFTRIYIPVAAVLTILSGSGRGGGYIGLTSDYESTAWFTAGLFFTISLILIIYKSLRLRKQS